MMRWKYSGLNKLWTSTGRGGDGGAYYSLRWLPYNPKLINGIAGASMAVLILQTLSVLGDQRGPSGTLFGSSLVSFGGLINVVTKAVW